MLVYNMAMIAPELVAEQHYFLEELVNPISLWTIRGICLMAGIVALIIYFKMKHKKGE